MRELHSQYLLRLLASGPFRLGQLTVTPGLIVSHTEDIGRQDLKIHTDPHDAIDLVRFDDSGVYRPLKPSANLRHGWQLRLKNIADLLLALDFIYPAAIGNALAREHSELPVTDLRATLGRQSGMYAVVAKITDEQASCVVSDLCEKSCLRQRLWRIDDCADRHPEPDSASGIPLWCPEACNLFVAAGRSVVKGK